MDHESRPTLGVIEDSDEDFAVLARVCRPEWELRRWTTGEAALDEFRRDSRKLDDLAVLIVDMNLGGLTGDEVVDRVREFPEGRAVPVCLFTGSRREADRRRAAFSTADAYLVKPGSAERLRRLPELLAQLAGKRERPTGPAERRSPGAVDLRSTRPPGSTG